MNRRGTVNVRIEGLKPNEQVVLDQKVIQDLTCYNGNELNTESRIHSVDGLIYFQELKNRSLKVLLDFN